MEKVLNSNGLLDQLEGRYPEPVQVDYQEITVDLKPGDLFPSISKAYAEEIDRIVSYAMGPHDVYITATQLDRYFQTIVRLRVDWVNNELAKEFRQRRMDIFIPSFVAVMVRQIGRIDDEVYGYALIPTMSDGEFLSADEFFDVSRKLERLEAHGLKGVKGLPSEKTGVLDFMCLSIMNDTVTSYRRGSKVMALLAAVYEKMAIAETAVMVPRIKYGSRRQYANDIPNLILRATT